MNRPESEFQVSSYAFQVLSIRTLQSYVGSLKKCGVIQSQVVGFYVMKPET
jgi:hypothetical protein